MKGCSTSYLLIVQCRNEVYLRIKGGWTSLPRGIYVYVGSSNIKKPVLRVHRHFRRSKKIKWHIDYLTLRCDPILSIMVHGCSEDDLYNYLISQKDRFRVAVKEFGSTDKRGHITHLFTPKGAEVTDKIVILDIINNLISNVSKLPCCSMVEVVFNRF